MPYLYMSMHDVIFGRSIHVEFVQFYVVGGEKVRSVVMLLPQPESLGRCETIQIPKRMKAGTLL